MATNDPDFYQAPKFTPEPPQALPKQRGCFFYGCIIASILAVLMAIVLGVGAFFLYRLAARAIDQYTSTTPLELPKVNMPAEERQSLHERVSAFRKAADASTPTEPLVLTSDDINALIDDDPDMKGVLHVKLEGSEVKGQVSLPLDKLNVGMVRGRYLNGEAEFKVSLADGALKVTIDSIEVNGQKAPDEFIAGLRQQNVAAEFNKNDKTAQTMRKIESLEVKDSKVILKVRARGAVAPESPATKKEPQVEAVAPPPNGAAKSEPAKKAEPPSAEPPKAAAEPAAAEKSAPKP